jgi:hypothetical protein
VSSVSRRRVPYWLQLLGAVLLLSALWLLAGVVAGWLGLELCAPTVQGGDC